MELNVEIIKTWNNWNNNNKIVKIASKDGRHLTGVADISNGYLKFIFGNGDCTYANIDDIVFILPIKKQPAMVV